MFTGEDFFLDKTSIHLKRIGNGTFSSVYLTDYKGGKVILKKYKKEERFKKYALKEIEILKNLEEKDINNIIYFYGSFEHYGYDYLVLEYVKNDLYKYIFINDNKITFDETLNITKKILNGLDYIHKNNIIHCDLKPENIVYEPEIDCLKIIDFGSAMYTYEEKTSFYIQSRFYRAPEVIFNLKYNHLIDIWSCACITYEILFRTPLFKCKNEDELVSQLCNMLGIPPKLYKTSNKFNKYYCVKDEIFYLKDDNYKIINPEMTGLETNISIKLSRKCKYIDHNLRNRFIDFLKSIITYDFNERLEASDLLQNKLFNRY